MWQRREIENYLCARAGLEAYAASSAGEAVPGPLFTGTEKDMRRRTMREAIDEIEAAQAFNLERHGIMHERRDHAADGEEPTMEDNMRIADLFLPRTRDLSG